MSPSSFLSENSEGDCNTQGSRMKGMAKGKGPGVALSLSVVAS